MSPSDRNCCNFGISEKRIVHGYSNCAIITILEMIKLIFDAHICCNYGNSKNNIWILVRTIVAIMATLKKM